MNHVVVLVGLGERGDAGAVLRLRRGFVSLHDARGGGAVAADQEVAARLLYTPNSRSRRNGAPTYRVEGGDTEQGKRLGPALHESDADDAGSPQSVGGTRRAWHGVAALLLLFVLLASHRPEDLTRAQFWAEDGPVFFAPAYNDGALRSALQPYAGYLHATARLVAAVAVAVPLTAAPLAFAVCAILIRVAVLALLLSRFPTEGSARGVFAILAIVYAGLPSSSEIHGNLANSHWHVGLLGFLILIAEPPRSKRWRVFDACALFVAALSTPLSLFMVPVAVAVYWSRRSAAAERLLRIAIACAAVQLLALACTGVGRLRHDVPPSLGDFVEVIGGKLFLGGLLGTRTREAIYANLAATDYRVLCLVCASLVFSLLALALWKGEARLRLFLLFALQVLAAVMAVIPWPALAGEGQGERYLFLPSLGLATALLWAAGHAQPIALRVAACVALALLATGIARDWRYVPPADGDFRGQVRQFERVPAGEEYTFRINPSGWPMTLVRR